MRALFRSFAVEMSDAEFCFSPLGQFEGDTDRYVASILFGCIPVMLTSTQYGGGRAPLAAPLDEHPALDWSAFSVNVALEQIKDLPSILGSISARKRAKMRHALSRVWRRFLYTSMYGAYLGEDGADDAFESFIDVLRQRVAAMPPLPTHD